jgi:uncharacterized membrane protein YbhN (UPF0104 family)
VAARKAGINDAALVTASILVEAGISAVAGVIVFVISLAWVKGVDAPIAPLVAFAVIVAILLHPRIFRPLAARLLRRLGRAELPPFRTSTMVFLLLFYSVTWVIGGSALWLLLRSLGAHPGPESFVFLGGVAAVGAIVAVLAVFAPSGLGVREASMYGLMLAIVGPGARSARRSQSRRDHAGRDTAARGRRADPPAQRGQAGAAPPPRSRGVGQLFFLSGK